MLHYRRRGDLFYVRGTVKIGQETRSVGEHSTGCREPAAAEEYGNALVRQITEEILYGRRRRPQRLTFADCGLSYLNRPGGLGGMEVSRLNILNDVIGDDPVTQIEEAWARFKLERCDGLDVRTIDRYRDCVQAVINHGAREWSFEAPKLPRLLKGREKRLRESRIRWLTIAHADRYFDAFADKRYRHAPPIFLFLRFQGARTSEALRCQIPALDLRRETVFLGDTKAGTNRSLKLHPRAAESIAAMLKARGNPDEGHLFLNRLGQPYADTRSYDIPGGNPLRALHAHAIRETKPVPNGGPDYTVHDWRHHWASWLVMEGTDLETLRRMGGWLDYRMVQRYAAVSTDHMAEAIGRLR